MGFIFQLVLRGDRKHVNNRRARKSNECVGGYTCKRKRNTRRAISALNNSIICDCSFIVFHHVRVASNLRSGSGDIQTYLDYTCVKL